MSNSYFQFKKFIIHQDDSVFKVNTDGVMLGCIVDIVSPTSILEIGTGTGVISMMMHQKYPEANIIGIDINEEAIKNSKFNLTKNEEHFAKKISFQNTNLIDFTSETTFDLILSNPPFFENSTKSNTQTNIMAKHTDSEFQENLIQLIKKLLSDDGFAYVIYSITEGLHFESKLKFHHLFIKERVVIYPNKRKNANRIIFKISKQKVKTLENIFHIRDEYNNYSEQFFEIGKDFYLKF